MKKRVSLLLALLLCAALVLSALPAPTAADGLSFISVNDMLPPELINCATSYGGGIYVPYSVFSGYGLGVGYSYFSAASTAYLYSGALDLYFDLVEGGCYDSDDYYYSASAIFYGGTVYVPLYFTAAYFGLSVKYISGNEYGSILRLTNGLQVLDDAEFLNAATRIMRDYAQRYSPAEPEPTETPAPTPTPTPTPTPDHTEETIRLCFLGLPGTAVLDALTERGLRACVFLTAEDIRNDADTVRRLVCTGWSVGICCESNGTADVSRISELLFDAARVRTALVCAPAANAEACRTGAARRDLVFVEADMDLTGIEPGASGAYPFTQQLDQGGNHILLLSGSEENLASLNMLLAYMERAKFGTELQRETNAGW